MTAQPTIVVCHSDEALNAEIAFWAASAQFQLLTARDRRDLQNYCATADRRLFVIELATQSEDALDTIEYVAAHSRGPVIAVSALDTKTISSIRRLLDAKSLNVMVIARADFNTRLLADVSNVATAQLQIDQTVLSGCIRDGYVTAHFQPKVPFKLSNEDYGVEALCRIDHPELGLIYPDSFIALAEANNLILELTDAVTVHAFRSLKMWSDAGLNLRLALNISPRLMGDTTWFDLFLHRCQEYKIDPTRITLEVTESSSQGGKVLALEILSRLRLKGFLLSIDDFGTGFSSLETLYRLPFGELKIDKGFVFDIQKNTEARALVESTAMLARKLGLKICAEGVESETIFNELRDMQCDDAQGYYISKPIHADKIAAFFRGWREKCRRDVTAGAENSKFAAIHALLTDLLSQPDDGEDATIVLGAAALVPQSGATSAREISSKIPAQILAGNLVAALEHTHRAMRASASDGDEEFRRKIARLQAELERSLAVSGGLTLQSPGQTVHILGGTSFIIGRYSPSTKADIAIPCRWLSRGEKNLRLFADANNWFVEDLGSTNGHFIEGRRLTPGQPVVLPAGETLIEVGKTGPGAAPAWLRLQCTRDHAVQINFGMDAPSDQAGNQATVASWIVFDRELSIGRGNEVALALADCAVDFVADITMRENVLWIAPRVGETVSIGSFEFTQAIPLPADIDLVLCKTSWTTRCPTASPVADAPESRMAISA